MYSRERGANMANEKWLIDANAIYDAVERRYRVSSGIEHRCERDLLDLICSADTVDAVEVVRCKDCKHCRLASWGERYCLRDRFVEIGDLREDDFCSYGERRDGE